MMEYSSVEEFYKHKMKTIEQKFYDVPDNVIIQKITPLFNKIKYKKDQKEKLKYYIERIETLLQNEKIPNYISNKIIEGKNKLIEILKKCSDTLAEIEKEDYAKVVILTNMFLFERIKDCDRFDDEEIDITNDIEILFTDLEYWIRLEQWDYVEEYAYKLNQEEPKRPIFQIPSPLEIYYNYCRIS